MEPAEQRNILLALVLFAAMMVAYEFLFAAPARQRAQAAKSTAAPQTEQQITQTNAPLTFQMRDDIVKADIAAGKRVLVEAPAIDGSIWLVGSRIDDISLKGFYVNIDAKLKQDTSQEVQLLSPQGTDRPFYATVGWTSEGG